MTIFAYRSYIYEYKDCKRKEKFDKEGGTKTLLRIQRGYMYDPEDNEMIVNELYYDSETDMKLGSKMNTFAASTFPKMILEKVEESDSKSYIEQIEVEDELSFKILRDLKELGKPKNLYFELQHL